MHKLVETRRTSDQQIYEKIKNRNWAKICKTSSFRDNILNSIDLRNRKYSHLNRSYYEIMKK